MAVDERPITINSRKYDGSIRRTWQAGLVSDRTDLILAVGVFDVDVEHSDLGLIRKGTVSFEHFWRDRWYNVFRFHEPDGSLRNYYCNIAIPPVLLGDTLDYVDLDIDVVVWPDGRCDVLDRDDFERNSEKFNYSDQVKTNVHRSLSELLDLIEKRDFPFEI